MMVRKIVQDEYSCSHSKVEYHEWEWKRLHWGIDLEYEDFHIDFGMFCWLLLLTIIKDEQAIPLKELHINKWMVEY